MSSHTYLASTQESENVSGDALNTLNDSNELKNWEQNNNKRKLKCMSINCQSVKTKTADIATVIDKHKLDFIRGNDSWLNPNIERNEIVPENYKIFRKDRVS